MDNIRERFEALDKSDQQRILDKHRYEVNFHDDWYQDICDQFSIKVMEMGIGINVQQGRNAIWFSGFSSQGDGACFEGYVADWDKVLADYPDLLKAEYNDRFMRWSSHGNYCHSNTLSFSWDLDMSNRFVEHMDRVRYMAREAEIGACAVQWSKFVEDFEKKVKGLCDDLYTKLEEENDYLTDDEQVLETLIANDLLEEELNEQESA